jgi:RNA polymerase sigma factor (sigma-70 family)
VLQPTEEVAALSEWPQVLTSLVNQRGAALKRYGYLLCGDNAEAEDLVQDALVRTFTSGRGSEITQAEQYVRKAMLNLFLDRVRRRRLWHRLMPLAATPEIREGHEDTDLRGDVKRALAHLSERQRACVVMRYYLDLPVAEISAALQISPGSVKRHLFEARGRLAVRLGSRTNTTEDGYAIP